jgi:hypothetical protein
VDVDFLPVGIGVLESSTEGKGKGYGERGERVRREEREEREGKERGGRGGDMGKRE